MSEVKQPASGDVGASSDSPADLWGLGDDDAITGPEQDAFGRVPFARHLADVIRTAPEAASFRIGLFGEWGEGKTSVMALMQRELGDADFVCVRISAWDAADVNLVVRRVATALAEEAGVDRAARARTRAALDLARGKLGPLRKLAAAAPLPIRLADAAVGDALERGIDAKLDEFRRYDAACLVQEANQKLGARRAVVFVDDLDRADPAALPRILMALREAVPLDGLVFVIALSSTAVADALEKSGYGLEAPDRFLEKIIEYPAYLPAILPGRLQAYAVARVSEIAGLRAPQVLQDLAPVLPSNPRRLKRYLRVLAALKRTLDRFDDAEIDWLGLYLAQLLLVEFPNEARALRADPAAVRALRGSRDLPAVLGGRPPTNDAPPPEATYAPADPDGRDRFLAICARIREQESAYGEYPVDALLNLDTAPPVLTRREAARRIDELADGPAQERPARIRAAITPDDGAADPEIACELWRRVVSYRDGALTAALRALDAGERGARERDVEALTDIAEAFARDARLFEDGLLDAAAWRRWLAHVRVFSSARDESGDVALRDREIGLLDDVLARAPLATLEEIAPTLEHELGYGRVPDVEYPAWYTDAVRRLAAHVERAVADGLLRRFETAGGLQGLVLADWDEHGKRLLVEPGSALYDASGRARLAELADRAADGDATIQANFLAVLRMLDGAANGQIRGSFVSEAAQVLADVGVLGPVWRGASTGPLTDRAAHVLARIRARAISRLGAGAASHLPVPGWWTPALRENATAAERAAAITGPATAGTDAGRDPSGAMAGAPGLAFEGSPDGAHHPSGTWEPAGRAEESSADAGRPHVPERPDPAPPTGTAA